MRNLILTFALLICFGTTYAQPAKSDYILPYFTQSKMLKVQRLLPGKVGDSLVTVSGTGRWMGKISIYDYGFITAAYTGFDTRYKPLSYTPAWNDITGKPNFAAAYKPIAYVPSWVEVTGKPDFPSLYKAIGYVPSWSEITGKPDFAALYKPIGYVPNWNEISGKPSFSNYLTGITYAQVIAALGYVPSAPVVPVYNNAPGRALNTAFTISTTKAARVTYTLSLTTALSLLNLNSAARVFLEISSNGTTWQAINSAGTSRTLAVSLSVGLNETSYWNLVGEVPANYQVRIRSVLSGGGTAAFDSGQEVTF